MFSFLRSGLACLLLAPIVFADDPAPEPHPFGPEWAKPEDPDKGCKFRLTKAGLIMTLPAKYHDFGGHSDKKNAPRMLRAVEGDFVAEIRLKGKFDPVGPSTRTNALLREPAVSAGFVLLESEKTFALLEREVQTSPDGKTKAGVASFTLTRDGKGTGTGASFQVPGDAYLQLTRKGDKLSAAMSDDGKTWHELRSFEVKLPAKLKLGLIARTTSSAVFAPEFDGFTLRKPKDR